MTNISLVAPSGVTGSIDGGGGSVYQILDGIVSVPSTLVAQLIGAGFRFLKSSGGMQAFFKAPKAAELVSIKAAATPANGSITIAAQPDYARKLQVRIVIGTPATTDITAGTLTLTGIDQDGQTVSEEISLVAAASATIKTTYAYAHLTSGVVANYAADGSGTGNTLGIGVANDLGIPGGVDNISMDLAKATKVVSTFTGAGTTVTDVAIVASDDVASTATVDAVARTVAPTTAPGPTATTSTDYLFNVAFGIAA